MSQFFILLLIVGVAVVKAYQKSKANDDTPPARRPQPVGETEEGAYAPEPFLTEEYTGYTAAPKPAITEKKAYYTAIKPPVPNEPEPDDEEEAEYGIYSADDARRALVQAEILTRKY